MIAVPAQNYNLYKFCILTTVESQSAGQDREPMASYAELASTNVSCSLAKLCVHMQWASSMMPL